MPVRRRARKAPAALALLRVRSKRQRGLMLTVVNAPPQVWDDAFRDVIPIATVAGGIVTLTFTAPDGRVFVKTQVQ